MRSIIGMPGGRHPSEITSVGIIESDSVAKGTSAIPSQMSPGQCVVSLIRPVRSCRNAE